MSARSRYRAGRVVAVAVRWARADARPGVGWIAALWATVKLGLVGLGSPFWAPIIMVRAAVNNRRARRLTAQFPDQVRAIAAGVPPNEPANRVAELDADLKLVVFSDLHRCVGGRIDWPERQGTKRLYEHLLDHYADGDWTLCENGDIEDYWMVGGSTYGAVYDGLRIAGVALDRAGRDELLVETYRAHLDEIVRNNAGIYLRLRQRFVQTGRYIRTVGNHDNPTGRAAVAERLREHLGVFPVADYVALRHRSELIAVITHGHHTDGWNAPGRDNLGKLSSWISNTLVDVPRLRAPEGLPPNDGIRRMLEGRLPDRLIRVNPTFGANSQYDSLDEELLWQVVFEAGLADVWMIFGHTHFPVLAPASRTGSRWERYANSGSGVNRGMITAVEWDGAIAHEARLVAWTLADDDTPADAVVTLPDGTRLGRFPLVPDGDHLVRDGVTVAAAD